MAVTVAILLAIGIGLTAGLFGGILLERDAQLRFGAPRPLPKAYVVRDEKLDIGPALKRSR